jgi:uncharacterized membrane protein YhaH (DUF805 family)
MFKKPFSFEGRIRRTEFGISYIIYFALYVLLFGFVEVLEFIPISYVAYVLFIPVLWFILAQGAKRCHDRDNSGWYQFIPFYLLWMFFADSNLGGNDYAPNAKGLGNGREIEDIGKE